MVIFLIFFRFNSQPISGVLSPMRDYLHAQEKNQYAIGKQLQPKGNIFMPKGNNIPVTLLKNLPAPCTNKAAWWI
jgi:hypothetical protein